MTAHFAELVQEDRIHADLYRDPELFEAEIDRIFNKTWVWVAHESELPAKNTFKTSHVGRQPVIVTRDRDGEIHVLLNRCRHRASTVCEAKSGKASVFVCPYHGWSYDPDGGLRKIPHKGGYDEGLDQADLGLKKLRVGQYNGLIFASFNEEIEPLEEFLGPARKWIDLFMKQGAGFGVQVRGEHRFRFPGNWKIQLENTTDAYHFPIVHKTFVSSLDKETGELFDILKQGGWVEDLGNGHSVLVMLPKLVDLEADLDDPIPARFAELAKELRREGHAEDVVRRVVRAVGGAGFNLNLFPSFACSMAFFRVLRPISVEETEIAHVALGMKDGPEAANLARLRLHEHFQGPMGFGSPDDAEGWERVQRGARAGDDMWILINRSTERDDAKDLGSDPDDVSSEAGMRGAYRMWQRMMAK